MNRSRNIDVDVALEPLCCEEKSSRELDEDLEMVILERKSKERGSDN